MQDFRIEDNLHRVINGYIYYNDNIINDPTAHLKIKGKQIYSQIIKGCFDLLSDREAFIFLCRNHSWNKDKEDQIKNLPTKIEKSKIKYFKTFFDPVRRKENLLELEYQIKTFEDLIAEKNTYFYYSPVGVATNGMWRFMIKEMYNGLKYADAISYYHKNKLDLNDIRDLSLSNDWMSYFSISEDVFNKNPLEMTDYQRDIIYWSKIYSNARSHPECPVEKILEDHNAFDGWMLNEQEQRLKDKKVSKINTHGKIDNARNVFLMTPPENIEEIYELNDDGGKSRIHSIFNELKGKGSVNDNDLSANRFNKKE